MEIAGAQPAASSVGGCLSQTACLPRETRAPTYHAAAGSSRTHHGRHHWRTASRSRKKWAFFLELQRRGSCGGLRRARARRLRRAPGRGCGRRRYRELRRPPSSLSARLRQAPGRQWWMFFSGATSRHCEIDAFHAFTKVDTILIIILALFSVLFLRACLGKIREVFQPRLYIMATWMQNTCRQLKNIIKIYVHLC
jgi:hypothetical protein